MKGKLKVMASSGESDHSAIGIPFLSGTGTTNLSCGFTYKITLFYTFYRCLETQSLLTFDKIIMAVLAMGLI